MWESPGFRPWHAPHIRRSLPRIPDKAQAHHTRCRCRCKSHTLLVMAPWSMEIWRCPESLAASALAPAALLWADLGLWGRLGNWRWLPYGKQVTWVPPRTEVQTLPV